MQTVINYIPIVDDHKDIFNYPMEKWVTTRLAFILEALEESSNLKVIIHSSSNDNLIEHECAIILERGGEVEVHHK